MVPNVSARALPRLTLILGGARSGKSAFAEAMVLRACAPDTRPIYVATADARDTEMAARIALHRDRRGARWQTVEEPLALAETIGLLSAPERPLLVECLTVWLANLLEAGRAPAPAISQLEGALARAAGPIVLVSNEVGLGIVPDNALARSFADGAGLLHQGLAARADRVLLVVAGLALSLKEPPP